MKAAMIHRSVLQRDPALAASDEVIGRWVRLLVHCSDVESGIGVGNATKYRRIGLAKIAGCKPWTDERWLRTTGTTAAGVVTVVDVGLARWRGPDLLVEGYDLFAQKRATENLRRLQDGGFVGKNNAPRQPPSDPAIAGSPRGGQSDGALAQPPIPSHPLRGSGSRDPLDPDPSLPVGGTGGREGSPSRGNSRGPEGFESWVRLYPKAWREGWRARALELWVRDDLEGIADVVCRYTAHRLKTDPAWRQKGPSGERSYYVPTPWNFLGRGGWRRPGPWEHEGPQPEQLERERPRARASATTPEVVSAGMVNVTDAHGYLLELLADDEIDEGTKERHRRAWQADHPGKRPPWLQNGGPS